MVARFYTIEKISKTRKRIKR